MKFCERLKQIRIETGMTQRDVYTRLNISPNGYASYEQGRTEPNIETLKKLCQIFNITSDYLLGLNDDNGSYQFEYQHGDTKLIHKEKK